MCGVFDSPSALGLVVVGFADGKEVRPKLTSGHFEHHHQHVQHQVAEEVDHVGSHEAPGAGLPSGGGVPSLGLGRIQAVTGFGEEYLKKGDSENFFSKMHAV